MKILLLSCLLAATTANAQTPVKTRQLSTVNAKVIAAPKAILIRKNVATLKVQSVQLKDSVAILKTEIDQLLDTIKDQQDSVSEMSETQSLRLQMAMDRLSKMISTLGNLLKKISDTSSQITQNLK